METLLKSWELWELVKSGISTFEDETQMSELLKKDARALHFIQQTLDENTITRISEA